MFNDVIKNILQEYKDIYEDKLKYINKYLSDSIIDKLALGEKLIKQNLGEKELKDYINTERRILDYILIEQFGLSNYLKFIDQFKQNKDYKIIIDLIVKPLNR